MYIASSLLLFPCLCLTAIAAEVVDFQLNRRAASDVLGSEVESNNTAPLDTFLPPFFLEAQTLEKDFVVSPIQDRSLELTGRQSCNAGYGYCAAAGGCCLLAQRCCSYGYCMDAGRACCPGGSCPAGSTCCGNNNCNPIGTQCCSNGKYCSQGNICVIYPGEPEPVCCTDLRCTARVVDGTTRFATTTTAAARPPATITPPPSTTTRAIVNQYETWYYTLTWWYLSYYWVTVQARSTVTYTTIYSTTTYTTEALNRDDASSRFAVLSRTLTFAAPASATSLRSLFGAAPAESSNVITMLDNTAGLGQSIPTPTTSSSTSSRTTSSASNQAGGPGSASQAGALLVGRGFCACGLLVGVLAFLL